MSKGRSASSADWKSLGGTSRNYVNTKSGEVLSRRQYDKKFGLLAKKKYSSYESKAKANRRKNPTLAAARPAHNRKSTLEATKLLERGKQIKVKKVVSKATDQKVWSKFQNIKVQIFYLAESQGPDYSRLAVNYEAVRKGLAENKRVFGVAINLVYSTKKIPNNVINLFETRTRASQIPADLLIERLAERHTNFNNSIPVRLKHLDLHVIFDSQHLAKIKGK